jgi:hypothetical protein
MSGGPFVLWLFGINLTSKYLGENLPWDIWHLGGTCGLLWCQLVIIKSCHTNNYAAVTRAVVSAQGGDTAKKKLSVLLVSVLHYLKQFWLWAHQGQG